MEIRKVLESVLTTGALVLAQAPSGSVAQTPLETEGESYIDTVSADVYNAAEFLLCEYAPAKLDFLQITDMSSATFISARSALGLIQGDFGGERNIAEMALLSGELAYWMDVEMRPVTNVEGEKVTHFPPDPELREEFLGHYNRLLEHLPHLESLYLQEHPEDAANVARISPLSNFTVNGRETYGPHTAFMRDQDFSQRLLDREDGSIPALPRPPAMTQEEFYRPADECTQVIS